MTLQHAALCTAFWIAILLFRRTGPTRGEAARYALGLALGAGFAHLGWVLLHLDALRANASSVLDPMAGYCVLFFPLGLLVTAPWRAVARDRQRYLGAALGALPLALASARIGCLLEGCCGGRPADVGPFEEHPTPLYQMVGLVAVHGVAARRPAPLVPGVVLSGIGLVRLLVQPLRAPPSLVPALSPQWLAGAWLLAGVLWTWRARLRKRPPVRPLPSAATPADDPLARSATAPPPADVSAG